MSATINGMPSAGSSSQTVPMSRGTTHYYQLASNAVRCVSNLVECAAFSSLAYHTTKLITGNLALPLNSSTAFIAKKILGQDRVNKLINTRFFNNFATQNLSKYLSINNKELLLASGLSLVAYLTFSAINHLGIKWLKHSLQKSQYDNRYDSYPFNDAFLNGKYSFVTGLGTVLCQNGGTWGYLRSHLFVNVFKRSTPAFVGHGNWCAAHPLLLHHTSSRRSNLGQNY